MLCWEMLDTPMPHADAAAHALVALAVGGGYTEHAGEGRAQTSATAGAVPVLSWQGMLTETAKTDAVTFLADMQAPDGGLRAHAEAREGDLLSTFTGALTLFALDGMDRLNVSALARFARQCIVPGGGFKACPDDVEADVEYTYYGLGTLGVLQAYVLARS
jgi:geranylgeranyl transferase type-2 subunit beta